MKSSLIDVIANKTGGISYKSQRYSVEVLENPFEAFDDQEKIFSINKHAETEKILAPKNLEGKAKFISAENNPAIFRFFLDGCRRTYKIDDIAYNNKVYPIMGGQVGVAACGRKNRELEPRLFENQIVVVLPNIACAGNDHSKFFKDLKSEINKNERLLERGLQLKECLSYQVKKLELGEKYENFGIAQIHSQMLETEKRIVQQLVAENSLNEESYLVKDGSIEYRNSTGDFRDLSIYKSNYRRVIGVSKSFNPDKCITHGNKSAAKQIADLPLFHRTPAFYYISGQSGNVSFAIWYLRIRAAEHSSGPFDGILKVEKILVTDKEIEEGLRSEEVDLISAHLINERHPVCYGSDSRWANHLYPIYLTELFIKSKFLSNEYFLNLF